MKCQNCGTDNANGARFCEKCGGSLEVVTPVQEASTSSNKKVTFTVADFFKTILDSIIHPMKAFKKLDEGTIADDSIYAYRRRARYIHGRGHADGHQPHR